MKKSIIIIQFIAIFAQFCSGQTNICFTYTKTGAREHREICLPFVKNCNSELDSIAIHDKLGLIDLYLSPNPTNGLLNIDIRSNSPIASGEFYVCDLRGKLLFTGVLNNDSNILDFSTYPKGILLLSIYVNGEKSNWKIIKQ